MPARKNMIFLTEVSETKKKYPAPINRHNKKEWKIVFLYLPPVS